jgi:hypothetical protein
MPASGFVFTGQSGCLLPTLIMLNLFFGKLIFNSNRLWLSVEGVLIFLFVINIYVFTRKISEQFKPKSRTRGKVIDVEGEVIQEKHKLQ